MSVVYSFTAQTVISSDQVDANFEDFAAEVSASLPVNGEKGMSGQLKAASGTAALPGIAFNSDTDCGLYRISGDTIGVSIAGVKVAELNTSGLAMASGYTVTDQDSVVVTGIPAGCMQMYVGTAAPTGWVRGNGRTIGNAASGATERANADTATLFALLYASYSDSVCAVSGGRSGVAATDYAANKTIALPDLRARAFFGLDDMGNSAASRLGTVITAPTTNGTSGGTETVALSTTHLAAHTHDLGSHTHTVSGTTADNTTSHSHGVNITSGTESAGHTHSGTTDNGSATHVHTNAGFVGSGVSTIAAAGATTVPSGAVANPDTGAAGADHTHTFTSGGASASHTHAVVGNTGTQSANHSHTLTGTAAAASGNTGSAGSGTAHPNMPPAWLGTFIIKL